MIPAVLVLVAVVGGQLPLPHCILWLGLVGAAPLGTALPWGVSVTV